MGVKRPKFGVEVGVRQALSIWYSGVAECNLYCFLQGEHAFS
jgi:hypothetical protein